MKRLFAVAGIGTALATLSVTCAGAANASDRFYLNNSTSSPAVTLNLSGDPVNSCVESGLAASALSFQIGSPGLAWAILNADACSPTYTAADGNGFVFRAHDPMVGASSLSCWVNGSDSADLVAQVDPPPGSGNNSTGSFEPIVDSLNVSNLFQGADGSTCNVTTPSVYIGFENPWIRSSKLKPQGHVRFWSDVAQVRHGYAYVPVALYGDTAKLREAVVLRQGKKNVAHGRQKAFAKRGKPGYIKVRLDRTLLRKLTKRSEIKVLATVRHVDRTRGTGHRSLLTLVKIPRSK